MWLLPEGAHRRATSWATLALFSFVPLFFVSPSFAASPGVAAGFQIDGNLVASTGFVDWYQAAGGIGTGVLFRKDDPNPVIRCTPVDALSTHFERDPSWAQGDNDITVFGKTSDKNNSCIVIGREPWNFKSGSGPPKNDISEAYVTVRTDDDPISPTFGHKFLIGGMGHRETNGDNHVDIEFNQLGLVKIFDPGSTTQGIIVGGPGSDSTCGRAINDQLFSVDFGNGGANPVIVRHEWHETSPDVFDYASVPIGVNFAATNTTVVEAPCDAIQPTSSTQLGPNYQVNQFIEFAIDITASGIPLSLFCSTTSTMTFKTRSSDCNGAVTTCELKDFITFPFNLVVPPTLALTPTDISCNGLNDGKIEATFSGGTAPYQIKIDAGAFAPGAVSPTTFSSLAPGPHTVVVKDANGCQDSKSVTLIQPDALTLTLTPTNISCNGLSDGKIEATFGGGTSPYQIQIDGGGYALATSPTTFSGLGVGPHKVDLKDDHGCPISKSETLTQPDALTLTLTPTNISCNGLSDGKIEATFGGGTSPYQIQIDGGGYAAATSPTTFSGLGVGPHKVDLKDDHGCPISKSETLTQPDALTLTLTPTNISCNGLSDGKIEATFGGGTSPYQIQIDGGGYAAATSPTTFSGLGVGPHKVDLKDDHGCPISKSETLTQPDALTLTLTPTNISCNGLSDGKIEATFGGGTSPYQIQIDGGGYAAATSPTTFSGLGVGPHKVDLKDDHGCPISKSETLTQPDELTLTLTPTNISCNGLSDGKIEATFGGGTSPYQIQIDGGGYAAATSPTTFSGLGVGPHKVDLKDDHGCPISKSETLTQPDELTLTLTPTNISCNGLSDGKIEATFGGGTSPYQIQIDGGGYAAATSPTTFSGLGVGPHKVDLKDDHGCPISKSETLTQPDELTLTLTPTNISCNGLSDGKIEATFGGGTSPYQIQIDGGGYAAATSPTTFSGLGVGPHKVDLKDDHGCPISKSETLTQPDALTLTLTPTNISCNGLSDGKIEATFGGGTSPYQIQIDGGGYAAASSPTTFSGLAAGPHKVDLKDDHGCPISKSETLTQPDELTLTLTPTNISCNGLSDGKIEATFGGGTSPYQIQIDGGGYAAATSPTTFSGLAAGPHKVDLKDDHGCPISKSETLTQPDELTLTLTPTNISCNGLSDGKIEATFGGGTSPYQIQIDGGGYAAATSPTTFSGLGVGPHKVDLKDDHGCPISKSETLTQPDELTLTLTPTNISCNGLSDGKIEATFGGGTSPYQIQIDGGGYAAATSPTTFSGLGVGPHKVDLKDDHGCPISKSETLTQPDELTLTLTPTNISCNGLSDGKIEATFGGGTSPYQIQIDGGGYAAATSPTTFSGLGVGPHKVDLKDDHGCPISKSETLTQPDELTLTLTPTNISCNGLSDGKIEATFGGGTSPYQIQIDGGGYAAATSPTTFSGLGVGPHKVDLKDDHGCPISKSETLTQPDELTLTLTPTNISCNGLSDGKIEATFGGGTSPYQIQIDGGGYAAATSPTTFSGLGVGPHKVDLKDDHGCPISKSETLTQPDELTLTLTPTNISCNGLSDGKIEATFGGGTSPYQIQIDGGGYAAATSPTTFSGLGVGPHKVDLKDDHGCPISKSETLTQPDELTLTLTPTNGTCGGTGGTITVTITGGTAPYLCKLDGGAYAPCASGDVYSSVAPGPHTVAVKDHNNCPASQSTTITQPQCGNITPTQTTCQDFIGGTSGDLTQVCYGVNRTGKINNTAPGVFFYYTKFTAQSSSFSVTIVQTKNNASFPFFVTQQGPAPAGQVTLYTGSCGLISHNAGSSEIGGVLTVPISGASAGQEFVIGVKYSTGSVVGINAGSGPTVTYSFHTEIGGVSSNSDALDLVKCGGPAVAAAVSEVSPETSQPGLDGVELYRALPNPFDGSTQFAYSVAGPKERVDIRVFDLSGRLLRTLQNGTQTSGRYFAVWDGRDDDGRRLNNAVYFISAVVGRERRIVRVVLMR